MKKIISLLIAVSLVLSMVPAMAQQAPIKVMLDGEYIQFDVEPKLIDDRTMVPVRAIFEALDATVEWDDATRTVTSKKGNIEISLKIDDNKLLRNGTAIELDVPAKLVDKRTLVPVRAISEAYDCWVDWNNSVNTVIIVSDLSDFEVMKVGDEKVSAGYFNYCLYNMGLVFAQSLGLSAQQIEDSWDTSLGDVSLGQYIVDMTCDNIGIIKAGKKNAAEKGVALTNAEIDKVSGTLVSFKEELGDDAAFEMVLDSIGTTQEDMRAYLEDVTLIDKLYMEYADELSMDEKQIKKYLDENYVQAQHVLISTQGLDEKAKAEKRETAEKVYEFARQGMEFEKLVETYGEDPGMTESPEGYLFTKGEMVKEFEDIAFNLKVGKISGVVETQFGYHIIKRVENQYTKEIFSEIRSVLVDDSVKAIFESLKDQSVITKNSGFMSNVTSASIQ